MCPNRQETRPLLGLLTHRGIHKACPGFHPGSHAGPKRTCLGSFALWASSVVREQGARSKACAAPSLLVAPMRQTPAASRRTPDRPIPSYVSANVPKSVARLPRFCRRRSQRLSCTRNRHTAVCTAGSWRDLPEIPAFTDWAASGMIDMLSGHGMTLGSRFGSAYGCVDRVSRQFDSWRLSGHPDY